MSLHLFCPECHNLMLPKYDSEKNGLVKECIICQYQTEVLEGGGDRMILQDTMGKTGGTYKTINPNLKYDRTRQHVSTVTCPNPVCPSNQGQPKDIITLQANQDMLMGYHCVKCDWEWTN